MERTSKDLLQLEQKNPSSSSLESTLRVCVNASLNSQRKETNPQGKPSTAPVPPSQVLSKVKDFLGVITEANARLQLDAKDNSEIFDIEALAGNESQVIEMDLMLGIADLHTPEAVAAAESAMAGYQPVIPLAVSSIDSESDDSSDEDNDCDEHDASDNHDGKTSSMKLRRSGSAKDKSSIYGKEKSKQRPKIVDMDVCQRVIAGFVGTTCSL